MLWIGEWLRARVNAVLDRLRRRKAAADVSPQAQRVAPVGNGAAEAPLPPEPPAPEREPEPTPKSASEPEPAPTAPTLEQAEIVALNRQDRRRLERARRRRDKLVEPKLDHIEAVTEHPAPKPEPKKPKKKKVKPELEIIDDPNDHIIAGELIDGDGQGDVLFEMSEFLGEFNFRDSILDQLDRYWFYLRRMRLHDKDSYEFYRQLGAVLVPYSKTGINDAKYYEIEKFTAEEIERIERSVMLSPWFKQTRPSWGCIAWGTNPLADERERKTKIMSPRFLYFVKYSDPPPECQATPNEGDVYKLTIWWDSSVGGRGARKWGVPNDIPIFISKDGNSIVPLKMIKTKMVRVAKRGNNFDYNLIPSREWRYPEQYEVWAASYGMSVELHLKSLFCAAMRDFEHSQYSTARVSVNKGDLAASFGINPRRIAYFFSDRDIIVTVSGKRKRIMHYVRPHVREGGAVVKGHFRGAREFSWAGYKVFITIPGLDHILLPEFNVGMTDAFWVEDWKKVIAEPEMGRMLSKVVHGESLKSAFSRDHHNDNTA